MSVLFIDFVQFLFFFFQAEDGIRDFCLSRGLGDVYKRQIQMRCSQQTYAEVNYTFDEEFLLTGINGAKHVKSNFTNFDEIDQELRKATQTIFVDGKLTRSNLNIDQSKTLITNYAKFDLNRFTWINIQKCIIFRSSEANVQKIYLKSFNYYFGCDAC
eukprot:TRINITY_DN22159_c0_g1_i1.p1 TRINITY_DN22159_c0_g1~~TRINITY_DN22159_c0_g1_i1.p1  ORF type:complete len:158 (-),score=12.21 TRINITY_DN22159_c0_g1_i1:29-502(-)